MYKCELFANCTLYEKIVQIKNEEITIEISTLLLLKLYKLYKLQKYSLDEKNEWFHKVESQSGASDFNGIL